MMLDENSNNKVILLPIACMVPDANAVLALLVLACRPREHFSRVGEERTTTLFISLRCGILIFDCECVPLFDTYMIDLPFASDHPSKFNIQTSRLLMLGYSVGH